MTKEKYSDDLWDIREIEVGTILRDWLDEGVRIILMRGPASITVYLGIPPTHPLAGYGYDDLPIDCHGGLTFSSEGGGHWPEGYYWYGYDYAHAGDYTQFKDSPSLVFEDDKKWTIKEVVADAWGAVYDLHKLMGLAEKVKNKAA
jgi:hypothetical protein